MNIDRGKQKERIIRKVQKEYPENSKEALSYCITLTILEENDNKIIKSKEVMGE